MLKYTKKVMKFGSKALTGKSLSVWLEFINETSEKFLVYKCKLSLALLHLAEMFINKLKTKCILFQAFGWWGAGKKLGRRWKIDEGKNRAGKGRECLYTFSHGTLSAHKYTADPVTVTWTTLWREYGFTCQS